jgi:hypothetical protein
MLINLHYAEKETPGHPWQDLWGILTAIEDIYARYPERFGTAAQRQELEKNLTHYIATHEHCLNKPDFYQYFVGQLAARGLNPFHDQSIAIVGGWVKWGTQTERGWVPKKTYDAADPLLACFAEFHDISIPSKGEAFTITNALEMTGGKKLDYVITGNVLNDPENYWGDDTLLACAKILKCGGKAIHMLGYGEDFHSGHIGNPYLHQLGGQSHCYNIPEGAYVCNRRRGGDATEMMVLEQTRDATPTKRTHRFYRQTMDYDPEHIENHALTTSSGDVSIRLGDLFRHIANHPERLDAMPEFSITELIHPPKTQDLRSGDAKALLRQEGFSPPEGISITEGQPLSTETIEQIKNSFIAWRDGVIRTLGLQLKQSGPATTTTERISISSEKILGGGKEGVSI